MRDLAAWLDFISAQHTLEIAMGLARSREVAQRLGVQRVAPKQLIIAGTNGKGSTALFAQALLIAQGHRVGTTLSPHLERFNERVLLQGEEVDDAALCAAFAAVEEARREIPLTYYEYSVLAALWLFRRAQLDVCVLEIGLGGRLDTINLLDADVAVITNIGLDHQSYLGETLEAIGAEKVAICRPGSPVILGHPQMPASVYEALAALDLVSGGVVSPRRVAPGRLSPGQVVQYGRHFWRAGEAGGGWSVQFADEVALESSQVPAIAQHNAAVASAAVSALTTHPTNAEFDRAVGAATNPGRAELSSYAGVPVLLDVAHNPAGATFLANQLSERYPGRRFVACAGFLADKDAAGVCAALRSQVRQWVITSTRGSRAMPAAAAARACGVQDAIVEPGFAEAVHRAHDACVGTDMMLVVGSFYQVQAMREFLLKADNIPSL